MTILMRAGELVGIQKVLDNGDYIVRERIPGGGTIERLVEASKTTAGREYAASLANLREEQER